MVWCGGCRLVLGPENSARPGYLRTAGITGPARQRSGVAVPVPQDNAAIVTRNSARALGR